MDELVRSLSRADLGTAIVAGLLAFGLLLTIQIGRSLLYAGIAGIMAGSVSLGQGHPPSTASVHAAMGFGVALLALLLSRLLRGLLPWLVITGLGMGALVFALRQ